MTAPKARGFRTADVGLASISETPADPAAERTGLAGDRASGGSQEGSHSN
jgi:hypothetical protein